MFESGWTYKEVLNNIETLRNQYHDFLMSFSIFEKKNNLRYAENLKQVYIH